MWIIQSPDYSNRSVRPSREPMSFLNLGPLLVVNRGAVADGDRHVHVRSMINDLIEADSRYQDLTDRWDDVPLNALAARAHEALAKFVVKSGIARNEVGFAVGGTMVGRLVNGRHLLDELGPPPERTLRVGPFIERLLAGSATLDEFSLLLETAASLPAGPMHVDARRPRPVGTTTRVVEIDFSPRGLTVRAPLENILKELDEAWGDPEQRRDEALAHLRSVRLDRWPFLATDLVVRYGAGLAATVRGETASLEYALGNPDLGGMEPEGLDIPAFNPSGNAALDRSRLRRWRRRLDQVEVAVSLAATSGAEPHRQTRPVRKDDLDSYRRHVFWLYESRANRRSLAMIADSEFDSRDRWRDIQRSIRRVSALLDMGEQRPYESRLHRMWARQNMRSGEASAEPPTFGR